MSDQESNNLTLINQWKERAAYAEKIHYQSSTKFRRHHYIWGITLIVFSTLEAGWATMSNTSVLLEWIFIGVSICTPILAAAIIFFKFQERSAQHHGAAAQYSSLKRSLQIFAANYDPEEGNEFIAELNELKKEWDRLSRDSPVPQLEERDNL